MSATSSKKATTGTPPAAPAIGLALGGGGARGLAHIVVLETFDELGLKPALIAGTSIGALIGAAYATGLTAREIGAQADDILGPPAEIARRLFSGGPASWLDLWTFRPFSAALMNPGALVEMVFPAAAAADFAELAIPLQVVATDYRQQMPVVLDGGKVGPAIAASIALPALFRPVEHQGLLLADGGLTNPLPYDLLAPACAVTVAIDVTGHLRLNDDRPPSALAAVLASAQIMQNAIVREKVARQPPDILIRPPVDAFRVLEFHKSPQIRAAAEPMKEDLKRALDARLNAAPEKTP